MYSNFSKIQEYRFNSKNINQVDNLDKIYNSFKNTNYKIAFDIKKNWYRQDNKLLGNKEFLIQDPDGFLLRFSEDLGEKDV